MIQINDLSKKYKGTDFFSVKDLDLNIPQGDLIILANTRIAKKCIIRDYNP